MSPKTTGKEELSLARKITLYAGVLTAVCLASAAGVSLLYVTNKDRIRQNELKSFRQTLEVVLSEAEDARPLIEGEKIGDAEIYVASLNDGVRYVARGAAQGYQSKITVLAAVDGPAPEKPVADDPVIEKVAVVSSGETPGLGENINKVKKDVSLWTALIGGGEDGGSTRPWFQAQFRQKRLADLRVDKSAETGITPITGATITSRATTRAVRQAVEKIIQKTRELYGPETTEKSRDAETMASP